MEKQLLDVGLSGVGSRLGGAVETPAFPPKSDADSTPASLELVIFQLTPQIWSYIQPAPSMLE